MESGVENSPARPSWPRRRSQPRHRSSWRPIADNFVRQGPAKRGARGCIATIDIRHQHRRSLRLPGG